MLYVPYFNKRYIKIKLSEEGEIGTGIPTPRRYIHVHSQSSFRDGQTWNCCAFLRIGELYRILTYKKIKARNSRAKKGKSPYRTLFVEHWIMLIHGESLRHKRKVCVLTCPKNKYRSYDKKYNRFLLKIDETKHSTAL